MPIQSHNRHNCSRLCVWPTKTGSDQQVLSNFLPSYAYCRSGDPLVGRCAIRGVDDAGVALLLEAAQACPSLVELVLHRNVIADAGARAIAAHMRSWPGLVDLDLGRNAIGDRQEEQEQGESDDHLLRSLISLPSTRSLNLALPESRSLHPTPLNSLPWLPKSTFSVVFGITRRALLYPMHGTA
jgi:hypothetical protein